jgi:hypothetical protein
MRPTYNFSIIFFLSAIGLSISSCYKGWPCEEPYYVDQSSIQVIFKDAATSGYLYPEFNAVYNRDSLKVFDPQGRPLKLLFSQNVDTNNLKHFWEVDINNIYDPSADDASFDSELCKSFIIQYNSVERDTIRTCFKARKTKCGSEFEILKVYHKDSLLVSEYNGIGALITIIKN